MRFTRRHAKPDGALDAAEAAAGSRERAEAELERQKDAASAEHHDVVAPLRRMRERNHLAEMFLKTIEEGYRR